MRKTIPTGRAASLVATVALATAAAPRSMLADEDYQFIRSGYPVANVSHSSASAGTNIATATRSVPAWASPLEARYRTMDESHGVDLRSDKIRATTIVLR